MTSPLIRLDFGGPPLHHGGMRTRRRFPPSGLAPIAVLVTLLSPAIVLGEVADLDHRLLTDKLVYRSGEPVVVSYEACNLSEQTVSHEYVGWCVPFTLSIENSEGNDIALYDSGPCPLIQGWWFPEWQPGECTARIEAPWPQRLYTNFNEDGWSPEGTRAPRGRYRLVVEWRTGTESGPVIVSDWFTIRARPLSPEGVAFE